MKYSCVVVAAGKSTRFKADTNKLLYKFEDGMAVIDKTLKIFQDDDDCSQIVVVTSEETMAYLSLTPDEKQQYCPGGETRADSVYNGLLAVKEDIVLVHDGARCYLLQQDIDALKEALETEDFALLVKDEVDTIKKVENGYVVSTVDRDTLKRALTPQGGKTELLITAYKKAVADGFKATDEAGVIEKYTDTKIKCVSAVGSNEKITTLNDIRKC